jgi:predicted DNA-binding transcriptional regulator AlpA
LKRAKGCLTRAFKNARTNPKRTAKAKTVGGQAREPLGVRLLDKGEVTAIANVTFTTIWSWMRDGKFPRGRIVCGKTQWLSTDIDAWLAALPVRPLKGDPPDQTKQQRDFAARLKGKRRRRVHSAPPPLAGRNKMIAAGERQPEVPDRCPISEKSAVANKLT